MPLEDDAPSAPDAPRQRAVPLLDPSGVLTVWMFRQVWEDVLVGAMHDIQS